MSAFMNERSSLGGKIPNGLFNAMFGFNCEAWARDASHTKCLAMDAYFITSFSLRFSRCSFILSDHLLQAVPTSWNPLQLARYGFVYNNYVPCITLTLHNMYMFHWAHFYIYIYAPRPISYIYTSTFSKFILISKIRNYTYKHLINYLSSSFEHVCMC